MSWREVARHARKRVLAAALASALTLPSAVAAINSYVQTNLVSDLPGMAKVLDPNLVNPWGISFSPTSPFWIANNGTGTSTLFNGQGQPFPLASPLVVTIPSPSGAMATAAPTGTVFNGTGMFLLDVGKPALFIFASEDGTISGWNPGVNPTMAVQKVAKEGAVYKGLALAMSDSGPLLYATNFHAGTVDVFNTSFSEVTVPGGFRDLDLPAGYAPFGIRAFGYRIYVTYALQDDARHDDVAGPGHGFVNVFDTNGRKLKRLISHDHLNSPWGLAWAPRNFGQFSNQLLVGNFGSGIVNAYSAGGDFLGSLRRPEGTIIEIPGLWGLAFGNGGNAGEPNVLFFTAGIPGPDGNVEDHGLFGSLSLKLPPGGDD
jgi:uncharacterized protein (TIGR03118 family)